MEGFGSCMEASSSEGEGAGQAVDLNSVAATTILASCGSKGNSDIVSPTCYEGGEHNVPVRFAKTSILKKDIEQRGRRLLA